MTFAYYTLLFFFSGATSLAYEILWLRELTLILGAHSFAVATILTAFMGGLGLGSLLIGRLARRIRRPLAVYGVFEIAIGLYALLLPQILPLAFPIYQTLGGASFAALTAARITLSLFLILPPTMLMGGTLPLLTERLASNIPRDGGLLYGSNTLGAVAGTLITAFLLLPRLGVFETTLAVTGANLLIGAMAMVGGLRDSAPGVSTPVPPRTTRRAGKPPRYVLSVFALSGLCAMIYEVAWTRVLTLLLGSTIYSFATMLATFLIGLSLGSIAAAWWRPKEPTKALGLVQIGVAISALVSQLLFSRLPALFLSLIGFFHTTGGTGIISAAKFLVAGSVMFVPTLLLGGVLPIVLAGIREGEHGGGELIGRAYAANMIGTIVGAPAAGFLLLPLLGVSRALTVAVLLNLGGGLFLLARSIRGGRVGRWMASGVVGSAVALAILGLLVAPAFNPLALSSELFGRASDADLVFYEEGLSSTVTVSRHYTLQPRLHLTLAIDGKANASTTGDMPTQVLVGQIPMLLARKADRVAVIGHGSGITTGSVARHPVREIVTIEIEPAVLAASRLFDEFSGGILDDPRVRLVREDARNWFLLNDERFDVIVSEPSHPWRGGSAKLFTQEFFRLGREHLESGGIFTQWIHFYGIRPGPLKALLRTFHSVFPEAMAFYTDAGDLILIGSDCPIPLDLHKIGRKMLSPKIAEDLDRIGVRSPYDLFTRFILGPEEIADYAGNGPLNTDDFTLVEFETPKSLFEDTITTHLVEMKEISAGPGKYLARDSDIPRATVDLQMARAYFSASMEEEALRTAEQAVRKTDDLRLHADARALVARMAVKEGDDAAAEHIWREIFSRFPDHPEATADLARFSQERGRYAEAAPLLKRLARRQPENATLIYLQAVNDYYLGQTKKALEGFSRVEPLARPFVHYYQSVALRRLGKEKEAKEALEKFLRALNEWRKELEEDPKRFSRLPYLATLRLRRERGIIIPEEERMAQIVEQIAVGPLNHLYRGVGLMTLGSLDEAQREMENGIKEMGRLGDATLAHFYLGLIARQKNDFGAAREHLSAYLARPPKESFRIEQARQLS